MHAQSRTNFQALHAINRSPSTFLSYVYSPDMDGKTKVDIVFRINYDHIQFRRSRDASGQYESVIELNFDIFEKDTPRIPDRPYISRETWRKTVLADSYEHTQSSDLYVTGKVSFKLAPDSYRLLTSFVVNDRPAPAFGTQNIPSGSFQASSSNRRTRGSSTTSRASLPLFEVPDFNNEAVFAIKIENDESNSSDLSLITLGQFVQYATNFDLVLGLPSKTDADSIIVAIHELGPVAGQVTDTAPLVWSKNISNDSKIRSASGLKLTEMADSMITVTFMEGDDYSVHRIPVPNSRFRNSWFRVSIYSYKEGVRSRMHNHSYQSRWFNIPTSLLNLDIAIDHLRYILDAEQIREIRRGSAQDRERKFRDFWASKDPTPDTDYNELMSEYYNRIDEAYKRFTTPSRAGHESDQGRIFIVYGPPEKIDRRFPPNGPTQEIWHYGSRTFIFNATSGFGDFQLVTP